MNDYISRHAAIDSLRAMQTYKLFAGDDQLLIDQAEAQTELMMLPPAQPEIIRCKECTYFDKYIDCKEMYQWDGFCADWARKTYENWYCSRAKRRNDG